MAASQTENEQIDDLKRWWKENGKAVIIGVVLGVSLGFAVWAYRDHNSSQAEAASTEYAELIGEVEKGDTKAGLVRGARIVSQYGGTSYAILAAFAMAKLELEQDKPAAARKHLQWALDNAEETNIQHIARLRLAKVMLSEKQPKQALDLISSVQPGSFSADYEEVRGDTYLALGESTSAQAAYERALTALGKDQANAEKRAALELKLGDLGVSQTDKEKTS